jgi:UDP-glucose 4-epimerase
LGNGSRFSVKQVVEAAREITGHSVPVVYGHRRSGDVAMLVADSAKIRRELGWEPVYTDVFSIIESAWKWHSKYPNGYDR